MTGRSVGKTRTISEFIQTEVQAGRAMQIGLAGQNEQTAIEIQVLNPRSGLIATSPPWFKAKWELGRVIWPNGAMAHVRTPESPGNIRGIEFDLAWLSETQSWPRVQGFEAWANFLAATRLGLARIVYDCTPKPFAPIVKQLLATAVNEPELHRLTTGSTEENRTNLSPGYIEEILRRFPPGTRKHTEEFLGRQLDESERALFKPALTRYLPQPSSFQRRVIGIDPAGTEDGRDKSGIVQAGVSNGLLYVIKDTSGRYSPNALADLVIKQYLTDGVDSICVETNKIGQWVAALLVLSARLLSPPVSVVVVRKGDPLPPRQPGTIYIKEVYANASRGDKGERAQPLSTAYEKHQVVHVEGANLSELEELMYTWDPDPMIKGQRSPDNLDALVWAATELLDLCGDGAPDLRKGFVGLVAANTELHKPSGKSPTVSYSFGGSTRGNRI